MRILLVIKSIDPAFGGPAETASRIPVILNARGHNVEVATLDAPGSPWLQDRGFTTHALGATRGLFPRLLRKYGFSPVLKPWIRQNAKNYDAIIIHGIWNYASFGTWRALKGSGKPYFVLLHGMLDPWFKSRYPLKHFKKSLYWPWADYKVLRDARAALFTCEEERRLAKKSFKLYKCNEAVVNYGVVAPPPDTGAQKRLFISKFPELSEKRLILYMGRIHPKKGCDILIKAFASLAYRDKTLHLVMAGPDQTGWLARLQGLAERLGISDRITWTGMLLDDFKWGAFYSAEVFILPSHQENFGITVVQAMACGLPVLITNMVNIYTEIESGGAGFVANDDLEGVVELLGKWFDLPSNKKIEMSQKCRKVFEEKFTMDAFVESLLRVFRQTGVLQ